MLEIFDKLQHLRMVVPWPVIVGVISTWAFLLVLEKTGKLRPEGVVILSATAGLAGFIGALSISFGWHNSGIYHANSIAYWVLFTIGLTIGAFVLLIATIHSLMLRWQSGKQRTLRGTPKEKE